jgi:hypothetical protein
VQTQVAIVTDLKAVRGPAGMLLRDEALASRIRETVNNIQQATANLGDGSRQADALISELNSRQIPRKAGEVMHNLNGSARQVLEMISEIKKPDQFGPLATPCPLSLGRSNGWTSLLEVRVAPLGR